MRSRSVQTRCTLLLWITWILLNSIRGTFVHSSLVYEITEEATAGSFVGNIVADDQILAELPRSQQSLLRFIILQGNTQRGKKPDQVVADYFQVEKHSGKIITARAIDREVICPRKVSCRISFQVVVTPADYFRVLSVQVELLDLNDNRPVFPNDGKFSVLIPESIFPGTIISIPHATDLDSPRNGVMRYVLTPTTDKFDLRTKAPSTSVQLVVTNALDYENETTYMFNITSFDGGDPCQSGVLSLIIVIEDVNDNSPIFEQTYYYVHLPEGRIGTPPISLLRVFAEDFDSGANGRVFYRLTEPEAEEDSRTASTSVSLFSMNETTGELFFTGSTPIDRETNPEFRLVVLASDGASVNRMTSSATIFVVVDDVNDNFPRISVDTLTSDDVAEIIEGSKLGTFVALVVVSDIDEGENSVTTCSLFDGYGYEADQFRLVEFDPNNYKLVTAAEMDRETKERHNLTISCIDRGVPALYSSHHLRILVRDINDNNPVFQTTFYNFTIRENMNGDVIAETILQVSASDADLGDNSRIVYSIADSDSWGFAIDSKTGSISTARALVDRERAADIVIYVVAADQGQSLRRSSTATVHFRVLDANDEAPVFLKSHYEFSVDENQAPGTVVGWVSAVDQDAEPPQNVLRYSLLYDQNLGELFLIDPDSGVIVTAEFLDREELPVYQLTVIAADLGSPSLSALATLTVTVSDLNDNPPIIDFPSSENPVIEIHWNPASGTKTTTITTRILARDLDSGRNAQLRYSLESPDSTTTDPFPVTIDFHSGLLRLVPEYSWPQDPKREHRIRVVVTDLGDPPLTASVEASILLVLTNRTQSGVTVTASAKHQKEEEDSDEKEAVWLNSDTAADAANRNVVILFVVLAVSGAGVALLLTGIVCLLFSSRSRPVSTAIAAELYENRFIAYSPSITRPTRPLHIYRP